MKRVGGKSPTLAARLAAVRGVLVHTLERGYYLTGFNTSAAHPGSSAVLIRRTVKHWDAVVAFVAATPGATVRVRPYFGAEARIAFGITHPGLSYDERG